MMICDDDYQYYEIIEFISKNNYGNIISEKYFIKVFHYAVHLVLLFYEDSEFEDR